MKFSFEWLKAHLETSASAEEITASAQELAATAQSLERLVSHFRL